LYNKNLNYICTKASRGKIRQQDRRGLLSLGGAFFAKMTADKN
jgi:hypothetical protein